MTLRREMLLYEVMRGLPNACLDCTNAQRVVQSGSLPVAHWWCSCLEAGAVGAWPRPQPRRSSPLAPALAAAGRCLSELMCCRTNPLPTLPGKPKQLKSSLVLFHYPAAYCELRLFKTRAERKAGKVRGLLLFGRSEHQLKYVLEHSSSRLLNGSPDSTVVKVMNVGDGKRSSHLLSWKV